MTASSEDPVLSGGPPRDEDGPGGQGRSEDGGRSVPQPASPPSRSPNPPPVAPPEAEAEAEAEDVTVKVRSRQVGTRPSNRRTMVCTTPSGEREPSGEDMGSSEVRLGKGRGNRTAGGDWEKVGKQDGRGRLGKGRGKQDDGVTREEKRPQRLAQHGVY